MFTRIIVPLDCSRFSEHALPVAASMAEATRGGLDLVHVHVPVKLPKYDGAMGQRARESLREQEDELRERELTYLSELGARLRSTRPRLTVTTRVLEGAVAPVVLREARPPEAQLIVTTTHGRGPMGRAVLGGTTDVLVRNAAIPVLVVRGTRSEPDLSETFRPDRILLPLDGTERSERAVSCAVACARPFRGELILLRVVGRGSGEESAARDYLDELATRIAVGGLKVDTMVVESRGRAEGILSATARAEADLVVLTTRGQGYLARLVMGSVAERLIRRGPTPVLVCRSSKQSALARTSEASDAGTVVPATG